MSCDLGKGDFVERITEHEACVCHAWMVKGGVYRVEAFDLDPTQCLICDGHHPWLVFTQDEPGDGWCPLQFRKLYRPDGEKLKRQLTGKVDGPEQPKRKAKRPLLVPDDMVVEMGR